LLLHRVGSRGEVYYGESSTSEGVTVTEGTFVPARSDEFRTPPLWGVADSAPYLHDGSAATLHDAVLAHEDQARNARDGYRRLSAVEQRALLVFLCALRAPRPGP
jgi:CxxC motif-containing protein (DUF1111 family)